MAPSISLGRVSETYIQKLVDGAGKRARILLLDNETTGMISLRATQSTLLKNDVFLVDKLENGMRQKMRHLDCICFVRPSSSSIAALVEELRTPKYASYVLYFSNALKKSQLNRLAEADDHEVVTKVQEMYLDMYVLNHDFFISNVQTIRGASPDVWKEEALDRSVDALVSTLLSLKARPLIRHDANSGVSKRLAHELSRIIKDQSQLFDFSRRDTPPVVLILDRRNDPLTPLLSHWTYQAMVDELLGIENNRVSLDRVPEISKDLQEVVLDADQDPFFAESMFLNFGDLGARIRDYVSQYQAKTQSNSKIESVADMKRFVEEYPEFRKLSGNVSKHVTLVGELSRQVDIQNLLNVSETEQSLASTANHNSDLRAVQVLLEHPAVSLLSKYRLVALYALRYEGSPNNSTRELLGMLESTNPGAETSKYRHAVEVLVNIFSDNTYRQEDLFGNGSLLSRAQQGLKGLKGVENVYTQHKPLLEQLLLALGRGKLKRQKYPFLDPGDGSLPHWAGNNDDHEVPQDIVVFIVGGATYEEARIVRELNEASTGVRITLGSTSTINSREFMDELGQAEWASTKTASDRLRNARGL